MTNVSDKHLYDVFAKAFHEVVIPILEELKEEMGAVKDRLTGVENRLGRVEDRLDKIDDRLDRHGSALDSHDRKIAKLELH